MPLSTWSDAVNWVSAVFAGQGAQLVDGEGNITVNSDAVKEVLAWFKKIVPSLPPSVFAWDNAANNKWLISGQGALIMNPPGAWAVIRSSPVLPGLLALSFVFYLLYGPVDVALPVHVATDLHGSAALLGMFWAVFGVGAVIGELTAPYLRRWRVWPTMTGIVLGWGLALIPLGLVTPLWTALAAFFVGAVIWGPWMSLSMGVLQDASPPAALAQVIAARGSLLILAAPLGTALGGPLVAALGARGTLLASGLATVALALVTAAILAARRRGSNRA